MESEVSENGTYSDGRHIGIKAWNSRRSKVRKWREENGRPLQVE